jgi:uncharacterized protein DUF3105
MASRKEEKERRRHERLAREQAERERSRARRLYAIIAGGTLVAAAVVAVVIAVMATGGGSDDASGAGFSKKAEQTLAPPPEKTKNLEQAAKLGNCELKNPPIEGHTHVLGKVKYGTNPPTSGNHYPIPTPDGVYTKEPEPTHFVHTLEHGRVELQYSPTLAKKRIRQLGGLFNEDPHIMVMFPNNTMPYKVAAAAWGHLIGCRKVNDATFDAIRAFRDRYRDKAPEPSITQPANF